MVMYPFIFQHNPETQEEFDDLEGLASQNFEQTNRQRYWLNESMDLNIKNIKKKNWLQQHGPFKKESF